MNRFAVPIERPLRLLRSAQAVRWLEDFGRTRLSKSFHMRDFLHSEVAEIYGLPNIPDDSDLAIRAGERLCEELLEPLSDRFGRIAIRSGFRSCAVNAVGHRNRLGCASNEGNYAAHIWDRRDAAGRMGATACVVIPWFSDRYAAGADWRSMAWFIHDHLGYSSLCVFPKLAALNIGWREHPRRAAWAPSVTMFAPDDDPLRLCSS